MKTLFRILAAAMLAGGLAHAVAAEPIDRIIVVVNDDVILQSELDAAMRDARLQLEQRGIPAPPEDVLRSQVLDRLILVRLQTQRAREAGIRVSDQELHRVLESLAQRNGMSLSQFAEALRQRGVDFLAVREQVRDEMLINQLRQREVEARVNVSERDVDLFLASQPEDESREFRLAHILVAVPGEATEAQREQARRKAETLRERALAGEDFAQLAVAHSDGQQALQGGDLGWLSAEELPSLFVEAVRRLPVGGISPVLEAASGFHIVKLVEERGGTPRQILRETRARHILIKPNAVRSDEQARQLAESLYQRLQAGEDFAALAAEYSDDPGSKNAGGDLGWQPEGAFVPEFQLRLDQLAPGERSAPFRSQYGWHIAEVLDRRTRDATEEARRARAREILFRRKAEEEYEIWLRRLRDEAYIEYRLAEDRDRPADAG